MARPSVYLLSTNNAGVYISVELHETARQSAVERLINVCDVIVLFM